VEVETTSTMSSAEVLRERLARLRAASVVEGESSIRQVRRTDRLSGDRMRIMTPDDDAADDHRRQAVHLRAFELDLFSDEGLGPELGADRGAALAKAEVTAGVVMAAVEVLVDQLFSDLVALESSDADSVQTHDDPESLLALSMLPTQYRHRYTPLFVRKFTVAAIAVTERLTREQWEPAVTVAEELALHLLGEQAEVLIELTGLEAEVDAGWRGAYNDAVLEDVDYEILYEPGMDGIEEDDDMAHLHMAPMSFSAWFRPFNEGRRTHPYASD
jgi:hypothetical protein